MRNCVLKNNLFYILAFLLLVIFAYIFVGTESVAASSSKLEPGLYNLNPQDIRFTQPNVSPHFNNGERVDELIPKLKSGEVSPYDLPPIQVVQKDGKLFSIDNRRLLAFNSAGVNKVTVQVVSLDDPGIATKLEDRFDPIIGAGQYAVVVPKAGRVEALALLEKYDMIKGVSNGY